jgi:signal transduction histidine kinase
MTFEEMTDKDHSGGVKFIRDFRGQKYPMEEVINRPRLLSIRSRRQGRDIVIEIRDQGSGLESAEKVFEPFFTTKEKGMGMGLAIGRSIVEAHDGRLSATRNETEGATFSFTLPIRAGHPA